MNSSHIYIYICLDYVILYATIIYTPPPINVYSVYLK